MRLIDADKLEPMERYVGDEFTRIVYMDDVDDMSTVDAVEIVRCRECIHLQKSGQCDKTSLWIGTKEDGGCDDFFCGYGERADAEPVRCGHWKIYDTYKQTIDGRTFDGWCECSECRTMYPWSFSTYDYCPHCGAKMEREECE